MKVLIMAGGTGGHVFPALAIAQSLRERGDEVLWLGTRGRMEEQLVPKYGFDIAYIDVKGIRGNGLGIKLKAPFMILHSAWQGLRIINKFKPDVALGMGGYASGPGGLACFLKGIKLCLHEQNAAAGLTNRLLSKVASRILLGFEGAFTGPKVEAVGNPVRKDIAAMYGAEHHFLKDECLHVMVLGGSLGAKYFNDNLPSFFKAFAQECPVPLKVFHQCGKGNREAVEKLYDGAPFSFEVSDFVDDMRQAYLQSDLLICRAGALTCAELCCAGVPCLFVPLPIAVDDHQTKNAQTLVKAGGALICQQKDLDEEKFASMLLGICSRQALTNMSRALYTQAKLDAVEKTVAVLDELSGKTLQKETGKPEESEQETQEQALAEEVQEQSAPLTQEEPGQSEPQAPVAAEAAAGTTEQEAGQSDSQQDVKTKASEGEEKSSGAPRRRRRRTTSGGAKPAQEQDAKAQEKQQSKASSSSDAAKAKPRARKAAAPKTGSRGQKSAEGTEAKSKTVAKDAGTGSRPRRRRTGTSYAQAGAKSTGEQS